VTLSRAAVSRVHAVRGDDGDLLRLYLELPPGTVVTPGALGAASPGPPVTAVRVGLADGRRVRVVVELDGATDFHVERARGSRVVALTVVGGPPAADAAPPAAAAVAPPPQAPPPPDRAPATRVARHRPKVVLDPGHGGDDPGAEGHAVEKEVTLDVARRLARLLRVRLGAEVVLTRDDDRTLALKERTGRANAEGADLFVSIHANAAPTGRLRGVETYVLDNAVDHATLRLAKMENGLDLLNPRPGNAGLRYILSDLVQVGKMGESVRLARSLQGGLVGHLRRSYRGVVDLGVKRGPFYVLVGAYMPCVLVETGFLTNPVEGHRVARQAYRQDVALGLYEGIARYLRDGARRRTL
jgi:N-acetylmuramoyl-L-alanine amidase